MNDYYKTENKYSLTKIPQKSIIKVLQRIGGKKHASNF